MKARHHVIVGNSAAAIGAVEGIRSVSREDLVTVIAAEPHHCYSRPLIAELLAGELSPGDLGYRPADFYQAQGVRALLGRRVEAVDAELHGVTLEDGEFIPYDRLLLATGSVPIRPDIADADGPGVFVFNSIADAQALADATRGTRRAVVAGGGLIGMKAAESLHRRGLQVTVVELAPRLLSSAFDRAAGRLLAARAEAAGLRLVTDNAVVAVERKAGMVAGVRLADGSLLPADLLVLAVGVRPNLALAAGAGVHVDRGVLVDDQMLTSAPDVYAAGDVAQGPELLSGEPRGLPLWPVACRQGQVAGTAMAGQPRDYPGGLAHNSLTLFGLCAMSAGRVEPEPGDTELAHGDGNGTYHKVLLRGDRLVGACAVGAVDRFGILTGLILDGQPCGFLRHSFPAFPVRLLSLPQEYRLARLGG